MTSQDTDRATQGLPAGAPGKRLAWSSWLAAGGSVARRHWPAIVLLSAGLVLRVLALVAYRPALFYIDTPRYLLGEAPGMDPLGYGGVLRAILAAGNFDVVVAVQHVLGLAMAVVIYLLVMRRGAGRWLGALAIAPLLLDAYQVQIEQVLMPDVWLEALIVAGLAVLLWRPGTGWRRALLAGFLLGSVGHGRADRRGAAAAGRDLPARGRGWLAPRDRQGCRADRGLRRADPGLHDRQLPDRRELLPVPHRCDVVLRQGRRGGRLRHTQASRGRARHVPRAAGSRRTDRTGSSTTGRHRSGRTTTTSHGRRPTPRSPTSTTRSSASSHCGCSPPTAPTSRSCSP